MLGFVQNLHCFSFGCPEWNYAQIGGNCPIPAVFQTLFPKPCSTRGWTKTLEQFPKLSLESWTRFFLRGQLSYGSHWLGKKIFKSRRFGVQHFPQRKVICREKLLEFCFLYSFSNACWGAWYSQFAGQWSMDQRTARGAQERGKSRGWGACERRLLNHPYSCYPKPLPIGQIVARGDCYGSRSISISEMHLRKRDFPDPPCFG